MKLWIGAAIVALTALLTSAPVTAQMAGAISNVYAIDVNGKGPAFVAEVQKIGALATKMGLPGEQTILLAEIAGAGTGIVFVSIEYPTLGAMDEANAKISATPEWQAFTAWTQSEGISVQSRTILRHIGD